MAFHFEETTLPGVLIVRPAVIADERGFFMETYRQSQFAAAGIAAPFVQQNQSRSVYGTLRGLHWQRAPKAQAKLIRVIHGQVFDVAVDIRRESPTFGRWAGVTLSAEDRRGVYIPAGCAHGFCVLSPEAEVMYGTTEEYTPELESGIRWDDPDLAIPWPVANPVLSARDRRWPSLAELP